MARDPNMEADKHAFHDMAAGTSPAALEQFKLERLLELRAVIDALRSERASGPTHQATNREPRFRQ
jgi:hypothetical protein